MSLRDKLPGLACGFTAVFATLAAVAKPPEQLSVSQWAGLHRVVGQESGSAHAGKWDNARQPCLLEVMDACQADNGIKRVIITGSAQFGKSEAPLNAIFHLICTVSPRPIMVVLPSIDEGLKWSETKWDPNVDETPELQQRVKVNKARSSEGSTSRKKRFTGSWLRIVSAGSSKELQSFTAGYLYCDEVAQFDQELAELQKTGGKKARKGFVGGDPISAAEVRMMTYKERRKTVLVSTPAFVGSCRITREYNASDKRRWFVPCPHCGDAFVLDFAMMGWMSGRPVFTAPCCGGVIEEHHKRRMNAAGFWLPTFEHELPSEEAQLADPQLLPAAEARREKNPAPPAIIPADEIDAYAPFNVEYGYRFAVRDCEGRARGYHLWQGQSNLASWSHIWEEKLKIDAGIGDEREFVQKFLGVAYEQKVDKPDVEKLYEARGKIWPLSGVVPPWACVLTGFIDVQINRLEWAVWGFGRGGIAARIATGVIPKNPKDWTTWSGDALTLITSEWAGPEFKSRVCDFVGVDTGGGIATDNVYRFCSLHGARNLLGTKGDSHDRGLAPLIKQGTPISTNWKGKKGQLRLWWLGTHALKERAYHGLALGLADAEEKPEILTARGLHLPRDATKEEIKQLTAEHMEKPDPRAKGRWILPSHTANEQLDMLCGCIALAHLEGIDRWTGGQWADRAAARAPSLAEKTLTPLEMIAAGKTEAPAMPDAPRFAAPAAEGGQGDNKAEQLARLAALGRQMSGQG